MDNLQCVDIHLGQPTHHLLVLRHHLVIIQIFARNRFEAWSHLYAGALVAPAVDGIQQALGQVGARSEELHLLADFHRGNAAGYAVIVAIVHAHQVIILILDGRRVDRHLGTELLPILRQLLRPQHRQVRFRCRAEVIKRVQVAETSLGHQRAAVHAHSAQRLRHPHGVTGKKVVVFRCAEETHDAELDNHLVHQFLRLFFRQFAFEDILLDINVEESRGTTDGHRSTVLVLHGGQISQINKLHGFARILCRTGHIETIRGTHLLEILQRPDLFRHLLTVTNDFIIQFLYVELFLKPLFVLYQTRRTIQCHTAIITDNAPAPVSVRKAGNDGRTAGGQHLLRVGREHAFVVRLAVFRENLLRHRIQVVTVCLQAVLHHSDATFRKYGPFQGRVCLQPDYDFVFPVYIARPVCRDALRKFGLRVIDPFLTFHLEHLGQFVPHLTGFL